MKTRDQEIEACILHLRRFAHALTGDGDRADDLVQDTVERALSRWNLRKPGLELRPWLFTILRNLHISAHRRAMRMVSDQHADIEDVHSLDSSAERQIELKQVLDLLSALPDEQRMAILLVSVEGFSYAEASKIMNIPQGTLMSRLNRARGKLRELVSTPPAQRLRRVK